MLSRLRKGLVYPVSTDITEHDLNTDAETWTYDSREVFRGNVDPAYLSEGLHVYWLYDDDNMRVGLAEHESDDENQFVALWFRANPFATMTQDDRWVSTDETLWSHMSSEAYDDCLRKGIQTPADLVRHYPAMKSTLVTPGMLVQADSWCATCCRPECKKDVVVRDPSQKIYIDDDFVIYAFTPSPDDDHPTPQEQVPEQEQALQQEALPEHPPSP